MSFRDYAPAPESTAILNLRPSYGLYIGGEWTDGRGGSMTTISPATEKSIAEISLADASDIDRAVAAARKSYDTVWSRMSGAERGKYLFRIARLIQERAREFAVAETLDNGKPIRETRDIDIPLVAAWFFHYAGWADKLDYAGLGPNPSALGVAGQIIPWNFPLLMLAWKVAPALAAGNTVVLKPAETTPLTALMFADICEQAGLPAGVVNIVPGLGGVAGQALVEHAGVNKIAFTGSTGVGRQIARTLAGTETRVTLELGGKGANIVFDDAAIDEAIEISYSRDITVQNTAIAETVGGHAFYGGVLMNYSNPAYGFKLDNVSLHHNIFNRIEGRLPEGSRESLAAANSFMNLELSNNLYWDPRFFIELGQSTGVVTNAGGEPYPIYWNLNAVNNYFHTGSAFPFSMFDDLILRRSANQLYVSGNRMNLYPGLSDYQLFYCCNDFNSVTDPADSSGLAQRRTIRNAFPAITYTPTDQLRSVLLNTAGAWPRDPMDTRLLGFVAAGTISSAPPDTNPAGDALLPAYSGSAPAAPADTDSDGMPDAWETANGLNPNAASPNSTQLSAQGYTDLEVYLQELSASRITGWSG